MRSKLCSVGVWWLLLFFSDISICSATRLLPVLGEDTKAHAGDVGSLPSSGDGHDGDRSRITDTVHDYTGDPPPQLHKPPHSLPADVMAANRVYHSDPNPSVGPPRLGLHPRRPKRPPPNEGLPPCTMPHC
ncbi:uncharacterized protein LOC120110098 [Phoenix dactylifera]|uniref:Uncharacterized protein LOC120110098 n=1 Tax=Phoenix dactylifera TaxID=42345 RepID=A0A8B9A062_PHODC|nr:uncharacterized protein LOC120110098 [Phoenix dactylifera]